MRSLILITLIITLHLIYDTQSGHTPHKTETHTRDVIQRLKSATLKSSPLTGEESLLPLLMEFEAEERQPSLKRTYHGAIHWTPSNDIQAIMASTTHLTRLGKHFSKSSLEPVVYQYMNGRMIVDDDCHFESDHIPPLPSFDQLFGQMQQIFSSPNNNQPPTFDAFINEKCQNLAKYHINYAGESFVICASEDSIHYVIGREIFFRITRFSPHTSLSGSLSIDDPSKPSKKITLNLSRVKTCPLSTYFISNIYKSALQRNAFHTPWFKESFICRFPYLRDLSSCKNEEHKDDEPKKDCVFLHGVGESESQPLSDSFVDYWGNIEDYTPQCKTRTFIHQETRMRGWNNRDLQMSFCEAALYDPTTNTTASDRTVRNKILFVHSMGNLILAGAIHNKYCSIDQSSTSWYDIMGPLDGSKAASVLQDICLMANMGWGSRLYRYIADKGGYCVPGTNSSFPAYKTLAPNFEELGILRSVAKPYVKGSMCGQSSYGLNSRYSVLYILSKFVGYDYPNDGMVVVPSCSVDPDFEYGPLYSDQFYVANINHADGTCRTGNSYWSLAKPCSFYQDKR